VDVNYISNVRASRSYSGCVMAELALGLIEFSLLRSLLTLAMMAETGVISEAEKTVLSDANAKVLESGVLFRGNAICFPGKNL
jgi:hypothetical protein